jgi:hypothetical protein
MVVIAKKRKVRTFGSRRRPTAEVTAASLLSPTNFNLSVKVQLLPPLSPSGLTNKIIFTVKCVSAVEGLQDLHLNALTGIILSLAAACHCLLAFVPCSLII